MTARQLLERVGQVLLVTLLWTASARADIVHLKGGQTIEGKILSETSAAIKIETRFGTTEISRDRIERIERKLTPREEYEKRLASLPPGDVNAIFELAMFCKEEKLTKESRKLLEDVLRLEPGHDGANEALGRTRYEGKWFTKEELEKFLEEQREEMEARGLVFHEGKWMTEEEAKAAQGLVLVDGEWVSEYEAERRKAVRDFEQVFSQPLYLHDSEHFSIRSMRAEDDVEYLLALCEQAYEHFVELSQPNEVQRKMLDYYKVVVYILNEPSHAQTFLDSGYIDRYLPPKGTKEKFEGYETYSVFFPRPLVVLTLGRHLKAGGDRETALTGMLLCYTGQVLVRRYKQGGAVPGWVETGFEHYFEGQFNNYSTVTLIEYPDHVPAVQKWIEGWETFPRWHEKLLDPAIRENLHSLPELLDQQAETLRVTDEAKSWSLVTFFLETRREQFFQYVTNAMTRFRGEDVSSTQAFRDVFGDDFAVLEAEWEKWLMNPRDVGRDQEPGGPLR